MSWWKRQLVVSYFPKHNVLQTLPKILQLWVWKKKCLFLRLGNYIFLYCYHSSANFLSPFISPTAFFVEHKKTKCPSFSFFFFFFGFPAQCTYSTKLGKFDQKMGNLVTRCFPPLNFGLMGPVFDLIHWELFFLIGPQYAGCLHTAAFSGRVLGAFPNLSQGIQCYLLTTFSPVNLFSFFFSPSV